MKALSNLGIIIQLIGAGYLIYLGIAGTGQSNTGLVIGLGLVIVGYLLHIFLDKKANSLTDFLDKKANSLPDFLEKKANSLPDSLNK